MNQRTKVKICGLYREEDIHMVNEILPDYVGFVLFVEKSHRNVTSNQVLQWKKLLNPTIKTVGVFVNVTEEQLHSVESALDVIQLHGEETEDYLAHLRKITTNKEFWKAFSVKTKEDVDTALKFSADKVLLDYGKGDGKSFDWNILKDITTPYILAGGITPDNVKHAIELGQPEIIDVSSGVETDKKKDKEKMKKLCEEIQKTWQ